MARNRSKRLLNRRQWLRPKQSWGPHSSVHTNVDLNEYSGERNLEGGISVTDCSRAINLDLNAETDRQHNLQLVMLDKLINELELVREAWIQGLDEIHTTGGWNVSDS